MATLQKQHQQQQNFAYDENDVMRYDADLYHQKYGNKWKRFASSIRDVKQEDGSIIREYLIEDPSLLEELSDDDFDSEYFKQEMDQEVEKIHQQMRQKLASDSVIEYEIMDEHGNLIKIDGAEHLKSLATSVKSIQQPDGSIVKEYLLNDPKIIEQIKSQIKRDSLVNQPTTSHQQHYHQPQIQHQQQLNSSDFKQIDFNKYEIRTKSGKIVQFAILNQHQSHDNNNLNEADLNEIKNAIENCTTRSDSKIESRSQTQAALKSSSSAQMMNHQKPKQQQPSSFKNYSTISRNKMESNQKIFQDQKRSLSLNELDNNTSQCSSTIASDTLKQFETNEVTAEMTEQLILKLLLQQLVHQKQQEPNLNSYKIKY